MPQPASDAELRMFNEQGTDLYLADDPKRHTSKFVNELDERSAQSTINGGAPDDIEAMIDN